MPEIHPTAICEGVSSLAEDVIIGPHCVLDGATGPITIGSGTRLIGNAWLTGPLTLGEGNLVYPFACLGFAPQDLKWDPRRAGAGVRIGDGNTFREHVTIHRATSDDAPTRIGDRNYFMAASHAGHDCVVGNNCILANAALLGGVVQVGDNVVLGGTAAVHQFARIGRGAMLSGAMGLSQDLPPWFMLTGTNVAGSINLLGLRRAGVRRDVIDDVRWVYRTIYRSGLAMSSAIDILRTRSRRPMVREYIEFIERSKRGICPGRGKAARGEGAVAGDPIH